MKKKKTKLIIGEALFYMALIAVVIVAIMFQAKKVGPRVVAGYSGFLVLSSSMEAEIPKDSLVITKSVDSQSLKIGDDITYLINPTTTITHRIIGITENYQESGMRAFETQGIMNEKPDEELVFPQNIVGKVIYHNYKMGRAINMLSEYWYFVVALLILLIGFYKSVRVIFEKSEETEEKKV